MADRFGDGTNRAMRERPRVKMRERPRVNRVERPVPKSNGAGIVGGQEVQEVIISFKKIYLHPGKLTVSLESCVVTTILGSCVAVCLWDPKTKAGGINHYLLPSYPGHGPRTERFGDVSVSKLIKKMIGLGCALQDLQAKLFGGACVLKAMQGRAQNLGLMNIEMARKALQKEGIHIIGEDVGGEKARKLHFDTKDGSVWIKQI